MVVTQPADGWVEWKGGDTAPADWDGVNVKFRLGHYTTEDGTYCWKHRRFPEDIIAYRLLAPSERK